MHFLDNAQTSNEILYWVMYGVIFLINQWATGFINFKVLKSQRLCLQSSTLGTSTKPLSSDSYFAVKTCENRFRWIKFIKMTMCIIYEPWLVHLYVYLNWQASIESASLCRWRNVIRRDVFSMTILQLRLLLYLKLKSRLQIISI